MGLSYYIGISFREFLPVDIGGKILIYLLELFQIPSRINNEMSSIESDNSGQATLGLHEVANGDRYMPVFDCDMIH